MKHVISAAICIAGIVIGASAQAVQNLPYPVPSLKGTDTVSIYGDFIEAFSGRSEKRSDVKRIPFSVFSESKTFPVASVSGFLTAIVVDKRVEAALSALLLDSWYQNLGEYEVFKQYIEGRKCFIYRNPALGLEFTFSLEKPDDRILSQINAAYVDKPDVRMEVRTHYMDNFVVRIFSAENIVNPGISEITFEEALVMATLIGDRFQWLWGIHNGSEILFRLPR